MMIGVLIIPANLYLAYNVGLNASKMQLSHLSLFVLFKTDSIVRNNSHLIWFSHNCDSLIDNYF